MQPRGKFASRNSSAEFPNRKKSFSPPPFSALDTSRRAPLNPPPRAPGNAMSRQPSKPIFIFIEGLNAYATAFYFNYLFFFMGAAHGWSDRQNLALSATHGFIYIFAAIIGGRCAHRIGYVPALRGGLAVMIAMLLAAGVSSAPAMQVAMLALWTIGVCFTWPTLEAAITDHEPPHRIPRMVGLYNLTWASGAALGYFTGGALLEKLGARSIFFVPAALHAVQIALTFVVAPAAPRETHRENPPSTTEGAAQVVPELNPRPIARARTFLRLAWFANPFAYIAINSILPVIPSISRKLELSPMFAGFFCSIWLFARLGAFVALWLWPGWHYRFGWFFSAYVVVTASYITLLLSTDLAVLVAAQIAFGLGLGLVYYSSLFYSMDAGGAKAEHGGVHEAAIGIGIFTGPAVGAASLYALPQFPRAATWAVSALLVAGLIGSLAIARSCRRLEAAAKS
jgi:predicted MFS family arabinose efflux permease